MITIHNSGCMGRAYSRLVIQAEDGEGTLALQIEDSENEMSVTVEITPLQAAKLAQVLRTWSDEVPEKSRPPLDFEGSL